jgi:quinolinate synthase
MIITPESLFEKLKNIKIGGTTCLFTEEKCKELAPKINEINRLKKEKNAVILAHSYVSPEIIYGVADAVGDSFELSKIAQQTTANTIVFAAVRFMADTAKLLNPTKEVFIPGRNNGCSLADSITASDVKTLKKQYPNHTFVCYINTSAEVKAECDVCVTSSNVYDILSKIPNDKIYFLPDKLMAINAQDELKKRGVQKTIDYWDGTCYVHEDYDVDMVTYLRKQHPDIDVVSHPECNAGVLNASDFVGSTSQIIKHVKESKHNKFLILTECGLTGRLKTEAPNKTFIGSCTLCKYMKSNTLNDILRVLTAPEPNDKIVLSESVQEKALACLTEMFRYTA